MGWESDSGIRELSRDPIIYWEAIIILETRRDIVGFKNITWPLLRYKDINYPQINLKFQYIPNTNTNKFVI